MKNISTIFAAAVLAILPFIGTSYVMHILIILLMWVVIGSAWNLLGGYCGQVSFGHAAFFGIGAYSSGLLYSHFGWSAWWGILLSIITTTFFSIILGFICLRLRGPYFALSTLAISEVLRVTSENLVKFTGGDLGILIKERTWVEKIWYYYIILFIAIATLFIIKKVIKSKLGYYFVAIREDQDAAESLGINTTFYKTIALALSGIFTGVAGAFYTNYMGYIDPKVVFALHDISIVAIMVVMIGGVATISGPIVGAIIMVPVAELIRSLPGLGAAHQTIFGILLIATIIFLPNGIAGDNEKIKKIFVKRGNR